MKAKEFFLKTNYPDFWTKKVRELKYKEGYENHFFELLCVNKNANVLEVGTGEGRFITKVLGKDATYLGIDISRGMLQRARERVSLTDASKVNLLVADIENLPFREDAFERAFCFATIYFVPNKDKGIEEMGRVAAKVLIEFRNLLSFEIFKYYLMHRLLLNFQGLSRFLLKREVSRRLLIPVYGEDRFLRVKRYLLTYRLVQPFYPVTLFGLKRLFKRVGMNIGRVEGYSSNSKLRMGLAKWRQPVLLVEATRISKAQEKLENSNFTPKELR